MIDDYKPNYWVFSEAQIDTPLRAWANDPRHDDVTEPAARARFEAVADFLYSRQARAAGLYKDGSQEK
jgi:hypothetical protein